MHAAENICILLCIIAALVIVARKLALPYPVVLVLAGLVLGFTPGPPAVVRLRPDVFFFFILPPLIYPAALAVSWRDFRRNLSSILLLAIGLVVATMFAVAWMAHHFVPVLPWASAVALGAIVSPTDTVAAAAIIRRLGVPHRLEAILEGESLVNDATGLVALQFAVAAAMTGTFSLAEATLRFIIVSIGGIAVGLGFGFINRLIQRHLDDPPVQIMISLLTPFAAYLTAERVHVSGVLAAVAAGMFVGWHSPLTLSARTRLQANAFWEMVVFLLNGLVFIIIGLQLPEIVAALRGVSIFALAGYALAICAAVIGARVAWALLATSAARAFVSRRSKTVPPFRQVIVIAWAGMRGVISLAAAFALPFALPDGTPFPGREYILFLTFAVIFVTLVFQGLTLPLLIRRLRIRHDASANEEERHARLKANEAALEFLNRTTDAHSFPAKLVAHLRTEYEERLGELREARHEGDRAGGVAVGDYKRLQQEALNVERCTIIRLRDELVINDEALRRIQRDLDLAEARLVGDEGLGA